MNPIVTITPSLPAMKEDAIAWARRVEAENAVFPQVPIATHHLIHAGMYARTIMIPAKTAITGALIKRATVLIVSGDVALNAGETLTRLVGYHVIPGHANRKQVIVAMADTWMTMLFPTDAQDVWTAEGEMTDEAELLFSRNGENFVTITGA